MIKWLLTVLESLLKSAVDLINSFLLTLLLEVVKSLSHLLADLFRGFQVSHEFLLVKMVFSLQKGLQSINLLKWQLMIPQAALFEIGLLSALKVGKAAADDGTLYDTLLLLFPHSLVAEVHITTDVIGKAGDSLYRYYKYIKKWCQSYSTVIFLNCSSILPLRPLFSGRCERLI